ncbi:hypothetical protein [Chitinophaga tropicalis]|uniref:Uncharacterized protein n=1 Tax=Chitinophaga tropicalis TaxID=2683588 RepID=A0A7K1UAG2_9BACT|nr:hypothetical protein [Chitinophaga tropicalis]MVT11364.1 hypothetical protein [Chitinophaga tropicalis]
MINMSSDFATSYVSKENNRYTVFGFFTAMPGSKDIHESRPTNLIQVTFRYIEEASGFLEMPRRFSYYIKEDDGKFSIGKIENQQFVPVHGELVTLVKEVVVEKYKIKADGKDDGEDSKEEQPNI